MVKRESKGGRLKRKAPVVKEEDEVIAEEAVANDSDGEEEAGAIEDMEEDGIEEAKADSKM